MNAGLYEPAWSELLTRRARRQNRTGLFILGFALFALSVMGDLDLAGVVILIGVILVHELGHLAAMWAFGYKELGVFFIPFFGAVATARSAGTSRPWQRGLVTLAGPVPGIVAGWAILGFSSQDVLSNPHVSVAAGMLLFVNGFNLLPMMPLDGGRLLNLAVFSKHPLLELAFTAAAGVCFVLFGLARGAWLTVGLGAFTVLAAFGQRRLIRAAHELRPALAGVVAEPTSLTEEQRQLLFDSAAATLESTEAATHRGFDWTPHHRAGVLASYMQVILDRATIASASAATSVLLVLVYLASCTLLLPLLPMFRG